MTITEDMQDAILKVLADAWTPAYDADEQVRDGAWVADITGLLDLSSWPAGMRVIVREERPHPGAQLRFTDLDGHRFTAFAADARKGQLADLELRHRRRVRCEDRIRCAKDTGLRNLPLKGFAHNQLWCEIVALACELLAWTQLLALAGEARRWGAQAPAAAPVRRRGAPGPRRPPLAAPPRRTLALGRPDHHRGHPPAGHPFRLTSQNRHCDTERATPLGPWNLRPPGATAGQPATARARKITTRRKDGPPRQPRERSRLVDRGGRLHRLRLCRRCATPWPIKSSRIVPLSSSQPSRPADRDRRESGWHDWSADACRQRRYRSAI
jgi:hypothetical protein